MDYALGIQRIPKIKSITTEAGNKIIAEFMGGVFGEVVNSPFSDYKAFHFEPNNNPNPHANCGTYKRLDDLEYHLRWDWLMPVVEKIESLRYDTTIVVDEDGQQMMIWEGGIYSYNRQEINMIVQNRLTGEKSKLKAVWLAVIEFINFYNSQQTQPT